MTDSKNDTLKLPKLSIIQLINLCIGFLGLQFAWSMQIALSSRVTEPLGADPLTFGLMWLAGPITGILVQPIIGVISDNTWTKFGRRRPFLIIGAILGSIALILFPMTKFIGDNYITFVPMLLIAASLLWIIDASVNISQGPYRALIPDIAPLEQHALANSFLSFAIGLGSVISFGAAPFVKAIFNYQMSLEQQFIMAAVAFTLGITWTCITTKEQAKPFDTKVSNEVVDENQNKKTNKESALEPIKNFFISTVIAFVGVVIIFIVYQFDLSNKDSVQTLLSWFVLILSIPMLLMALISFKSKEIYKLCAIQFCTWLGVMCMFIYFNNYIVHNVFQIPDLTTASEQVKSSFRLLEENATNVTQIALAIFNLVCLLISIPLGVFCSKFGKKNVHTLALLIMGISFLGMAFLSKGQTEVYIFMGLAGIGWASILALPFALLTEHIEDGTEGSSMGKFNLFIAGPQILSSVAVGYLIKVSPLMTSNGQTNHFDYAFIVGGIAVILAAILTQTVNEKYHQLKSNVSISGGH